MPVSVCSWCQAVSDGVPSLAGEGVRCKQCGKELLPASNEAGVLVARPFVPPPNPHWQPRPVVAPLGQTPAIDDREPLPALLIAVLSFLLLLLIGGAVWLTRDNRETGGQQVVASDEDIYRERERGEEERMRLQTVTPVARPMPARLPSPSADALRLQAEREAKAQAERAAKRAQELRLKQIAEQQRREQQARLKIEQEKARVLQARRQAEEEARRKEAAFRSALQTAKAALAKKNFDVAVTSFTAAERLRPGNPEVLLGLKRAQDGRRVADNLARQREKVRQEQEKKKTFQNLLASGRKALARAEFEHARNDFTRAGQLFPSEEARSGVLRAKRGLEEKRLREREAARKHAEAEARRQKELAAKRLEEQKRNDALANKHLVVGRQALKDKKFAQANSAFAAARKLSPQAPAVLQALRDLEAARRQANQAALDKLPLARKKK